MNSVIIFVGLFLILISMFFFLFGMIKEKKENKEKLKKAYKQTAKYNEVKKKMKKILRIWKVTTGLILLTLLLSCCTTLASKDKSEIENNFFIPYFPDLNENQTVIFYDENDPPAPISINVPWWWFKAVLKYASDVEAAAQAIQTQN